MSVPRSRLIACLCFVLVLYSLYLTRVPLRTRLQNTIQVASVATPLQPEPVPDHAPYGAVVISGRNDTDLSFVAFFRARWQLFLYDVDDARNKDSRLHIPMNKGREAMVYLSWIIDNYDHLPWAAIMLHGHAEAWHQLDNIVRMVRGINLEALAQAGYISFRCAWFPSCPAELRLIDHDAIAWGNRDMAETIEEVLSRDWSSLFPNEPLPPTVASQCCAQFAVTRAAITRRPKEHYKRLRSWLIDSSLDDERSGRVLEKLWAYIFTGDAVHCPPPEQCACEHFGQCNTHVFEQSPEGLPSFPQWP
ncbi:hypothetical protein K431DRAFT_280810 [Polychaeton citri CBS 116435]|uniref:Uncharacterized protein n=1 Tax=Polychaeton citri CBS 116435 TaxID=1314669 RepID=A0A9P4QID6_9PEZI|nr:hypothetical protein K431DRAFT_280810 [Polychaeton citri CBS 116435]